jgi:UDP:flavonoid glycosyltransferase YjiC (YdhE family)
LEELGEHVHAAPIVDGRAELRQADVAVLSGGHMTVMEAMLAGTPTVIANHTYQQAGAAQRADRLGTGIGLWPRRRPGDVGRAAVRILEDDSYRRRAREIAARLKDGWDGALNTARMAEELSG